MIPNESNRLPDNHQGFSSTLLFPYHATTVLALCGCWTLAVPLPILGFPTHTKAVAATSELNRLATTRMYFLIFFLVDNINDSVGRVDEKVHLIQQRSID